MSAIKKKSTLKFAEYDDGKATTWRLRSWSRSLASTPSSGSSWAWAAHSSHS